MIRINMFSQADSVKGQGVGSAYNELTALLRTRLVDKFYVTVNKYGKSDLTHYHTINPTFYANSFSPARGRRIIQMAGAQEAMYTFLAPASRAI